MKRLHALTEPELAQLVGVSVSTLAVHKREGCPMPRRKKDLTAWVAKYHEWRRTHKAPGPGTAAAPTSAKVGTDDYWTTKRKEYLARRARQAYLREAGLLVRRSEVIDFTTAAIAAVRSRLSDMVKKMAVRLHQAPSVEWIEEQLRAETNAICQAFAHGMTDDEHDETAAAAGEGPSDPRGLEAETGTDGEPVG